MLFSVNKVVLKSRMSGLEYNNVNYFIKKYESDCCICLSYPKDSIIIDCNHVFCRGCILEMLEFYKKCPICYKKVTNVFKVKLIILHEIKDYICFKKITSSDQVDYFSYPYLSVYYDEPFTFQVTKLIYQSYDGQPYFLNNKMITKKEDCPDFIYGKITKITPLKINKEDVMKNNNNLHITEFSVIYIVDIEHA